MATHPQGIVIDIVGVEKSNRGRSCERHDVCGNHLGLDAVLRLRQVQIVKENGREEKAVAAYLVTEGVDSCRVGFLPRQCLKHAEKFDGKLAQITKFLAESDSPHCRHLSHRNRGIVRAVIITLRNLTRRCTPLRKLYCWLLMWRMQLLDLLEMNMTKITIL
jgi:hypothetical protein